MSYLLKPSILTGFVSGWLTMEDNKQRRLVLRPITNPHHLTMVFPITLKSIFNSKKRSLGVFTFPTMVQHVDTCSKFIIISVVQ